MNNLRTPQWVAGIVAMLVLVCGTSIVDAQQGYWRSKQRPFTAIFAFGDSLTDIGNLFRDTNMQVPPPQFGYFQGRVSNGPIWIDYLAQEMNLELELANNYAYSGATTGRDNVNDGFYGLDNLPGLQDQIDAFEDDLNGQRADKDALYIIWAGANDFFELGDDPFKTIITGVTNTRIAVRRLRRLGARRIMVVNLPDLGLTPNYNDPETAQQFSRLSSIYNFYLEWTLRWDQWRGIKTIRVDVATTLRKIARNPGDFGFSNVTEGWLFSAMDLPPFLFLFWDDFHPTTEGHGFIADEAFRVLRWHYPYLLRR